MGLLAGSDADEERIFVVAAADGDSSFFLETRPHFCLFLVLGSLEARRRFLAAAAEGDVGSLTVASGSVSSFMVEEGSVSLSVLTVIERFTSLLLLLLAWTLRTFLTVTGSLREKGFLECGTRTRS